MRGRYGGDINMFHKFDMALCGITVENAALSFLLVGHLCHRSSKVTPNTYSYLLSHKQY